MINKLVLLFLLIASQALWGNEIQGEMTPRDNRPLEMEEGSIADIVVRLWNLPQTFDVTSLEKIKELSKSFQIIQIENVEESKNNHEVLELYAEVVLLKAFEPRSKLDLVLNDGLVIKLDVRNITTIATAPVGEDFILVEQQNNTWENVRNMTIPGITLVVIALLLYMFYKKYKKKELLTKRKMNARAMIENAKTRHDYEKLAAEIVNYVELLNLPPEKVNDYLEFLELHQYRRDWSPEVLDVMQKKVSDIVNA